MDCQRHLLGFHLERHAWRRMVVAAEEIPMATADQWGRSVVDWQTLCRIEYRCDRCGAVRSGGNCGCDKIRGDVCPARLEWLARRD